jgi:hypothetical protein
MELGPESEPGNPLARNATAQLPDNGTRIDDNAKLLSFREPRSNLPQRTLNGELFFVPL